MTDALIYCLFAALPLLSPKVRRIMADTSWAAKAGGLAVILALVWAQVQRDSNATYPLKTWTMYHWPKPTPQSYLIVQGFRADGTAVALPERRWIPVGLRQFTHRFYVLGVELDRLDAEQDEARMAELARLTEESLGVLGQIHNRRNRGEVVRVSLEKHLIQPGHSIQSEVIASIDLPAL